MIRRSIAGRIMVTMRPCLHRPGTSLSYAKPIPVKQIHLTTHFLGDVEDRKLLDNVEQGKVSCASGCLVVHYEPHFWISAGFSAA